MHRDPYDQARRSAVAWACGTLRKLGVHFEAAAKAESGFDGWHVLTPDGWEAAETAQEIATIAKRCQDDAARVAAGKG